MDSFKDVLEAAQAYCKTQYVWKFIKNVPSISSILKIKSIKKL